MKRARSEDKPSNEEDQISQKLANTEYGSLEEKVKRMIEKQKQKSNNNKPKPAKTSNASDESMHPNKKRRKFEKELSAVSGADEAALLSNPDVANYVNNRTVYIQGLPFTSSDEEVRNFFREISDIKAIRLPRWHDSGKLKGYGHVEFESEESAERALELSGQYLQDRYITVEKPMIPRALSSAPSSSSKTSQPSTTTSERPPGCRTIFIRNLPYDVTEEEIRQEFMVYGPIVSVRLAVWNHTNNLKGFGYIEFKREDSSEIAVKKSGTIRLKGRPVAVDYETQGPKKGFKGLHADEKKKKK
eukprot:gene11273-12281_t